MRMLYIAALFCTGCSGGPIDQTTASASGMEAVSMEFYKRRIAEKNEVITPPVLLRLSGKLVEKNNCLVVSNDEGDHALVFEEGKATFDPVRKALSVGSTMILLDEPISVGGPFNQPSEDLDIASIKSRCDVKAVWLVTGTDVQSAP